jgi:hypothetical protein
VTILDDIVESRALVRHPPGDVHVPFDDLFSNDEVETRLRDAIKRGGLVSLNGVSGSGKSSTLDFVIDDLVESRLAFPIICPVHYDHEPALVDESGFLDYLSGRLIHALEQSDLAAQATELHDGATSTATVGRPKRWSKAFSVKTPSFLPVEVSGTAQQALAANRERKRSSSEVAEAIDAAIEVLLDSDFVPVLVFDDTDVWAKGVDDEEERRRINFFFGSIIPILSRRSCSSLVAMHPAYETNGVVRHSNPFFETRVVIPRLADSAQLKELLLGRVLAVVGIDEEWISDTAIEYLFEVYEDSSGGDLRSILSCASHAVGHALRNGQLAVDTPDVEYAFSQSTTMT